MAVSETHAVAVPVPVPDPRRWRALALLCAAYFMIIVDAQIVVLALPSIQTQLHFTASGLQWVMSAYLLSFGGLLLFGGRTADLLGGRRMFMIGTVLFLVASVVCAAAWSAGVLVGARIGQGVAAALMAPTAMAILMNIFPDGPERNRAVGIWTGIGAFGATAALLVGGPITEGLGWQWIFLINVPVALVVLVVGPRLLRETPIRPGARSFDPAGALTITAALGLVVYAVVGAPAAGWLTPQVLVPLGAAIVLFVVFVLVERRSAAPLVPLRIFRSSATLGGNLLTLLVAMAIYGGALLMSIYAQEVLGYGVVLFGLSTAIYAAMSVLASNLSGPLTSRFGYPAVAVVGTTLLGIGTFLFTRVPADGNYWTDLFPAMVVFGFGIGTTVVAAAIAALSGVAPHESGLASGINNAVFQIGAALGIALCATVSVAFTDPAAADERAGLTAGIQAAFGATLVFSVTGLVVALVLGLARRRTAAAVGNSLRTGGSAPDGSER